MTSSLFELTSQKRAPFGLASLIRRITASRFNGGEVSDPYTSGYFFENGPPAQIDDTDAPAGTAIPLLYPAAWRGGASSSFAAASRSAVRSPSSTTGW